MHLTDDQSDHFDFLGNQWLSEAERDLMKKRQEETEARIRDEQRKIVVTLDIAGRRIVQHNTEDLAYQQEDVNASPLEYANQIEARNNSLSSGLSSRGGSVVPEDEEVMDEESLLDPFRIAETDHRQSGAFQNPFLQCQRPAFLPSGTKRGKDFLQSEGIKSSHERTRPTSHHLA